MENHRKLERFDLIIQNFDEIIQTKTSKITVGELVDNFNSKFVNRQELDDFLKHGEKSKKA